MKTSDTHKEIELTLNSLDDLEKAKAPDDFLESLTNKMIFRKEQRLWVNRTKYAIAGMLVFTIVNVALLVNSKTSQRKEMIRSVAKEWNLKTEEY